jgi:hypothetical protein
VIDNSAVHIPGPHLGFSVRATLSNRASGSKLPGQE